VWKGGASCRFLEYLRDLDWHETLKKILELDIDFAMMFGN